MFYVTEVAITSHWKHACLSSIYVIALQPHSQVKADEDYWHGMGISSWCSIDYHEGHFVTSQTIDPLLRVFSIKYKYLYA